MLVHIYTYGAKLQDEVDAVFPHTLNKLSLNASKGKKRLEINLRELDPV